MTFPFRDLGTLCIINSTKFFCKYKLWSYNCTYVVMLLVGVFGGCLYKYPDSVDTDLNSRLPNILTLEEHDKQLFTKDFYKNLISSSKEIGLKLHKVLVDYLNPQSEEVDRVLKYNQVINIYWSFLKSIAKNISKLTIEQKILFRFAALIPNALGSEIQLLISKTIWDNHYNESFIYFDEWLYGVNSFKLSRLATDLPMDNFKEEDLEKILLNKKEKLLANIDFAKSSLKRTDKIREEALCRLRSMFGFLFSNNDQNDLAYMPEYGVRSPYANSILKPLNFASDYVDDLIKSNRDVNIFINKIEDANRELFEIQNKMNNIGMSVESTIAHDEVEAIRSANKLAIGPRGNHFPILLRNNVVANPQLFGSRERIIQLVWEIEDIQPRLFQKAYRGDLLRVVPYFILIPSYGDKGICWEPIDVKNRANGRGKILIPMYAKNLRKAVILGIGDFVWELAKEQASFRWMETGITGQYYDYYVKFIKKGNVKNFFLEDYFLWIDKESKGIQKLEKLVRGIMWRNLPFSKNLKETLAKKSFIYKDLLDKDKNIQASDGY
ncbi:hypothetical protein BAPKO_0417 [Borreliella afzelii PKo]|nr:hypothetical protein BAPKO_0417 [Borreliella afzelii PKo]